MIGTVSITDLKIHCIVGILPRERNEAQTIYLDVEMDHDFEMAAKTERVEHTVDYAEVSAGLTELATRAQFQLIETLAEQSAELIFERWRSVRRCKVTVKKPDAVPAARHTAVSVERYPSA